jgi:hypothetical protein
LTRKSLIILIKHVDVQFDKIGHSNQIH